MDRVKRRKRYSCCGGSLNCGVNILEREVDKVLAQYIKNKVKGRENLLNWLLCLEDERDWYKLKLQKLRKEIKTK